jgi:hypothetical protein
MIYFLQVTVLTVDGKEQKTATNMLIYDTHVSESISFLGNDVKR